MLRRSETRVGVAIPVLHADTGDRLALRAGGLSLRANVSWTFVGNVVYAASQWGMLIVLAKLGSPAMVGRFALGLALTAPVIMFSNLNLRSVQATDARHEYRFGEYLALRIAMTAAAFLVMLGIVGVSRYGFETASAIALIAVAKSFESISDVIYGLLQQHERMDLIAISMMIKGPASLAALGTGLYLSGQLFWGIAAFAAVWAAVMALYDMPNARRLLAVTSPNLGGVRMVAGASNLIAPVWNRKRLLALAWLALPLGAVMMFVSFNANVPRYFVEHFDGDSDLGIFAAQASLMVAGYTVVNALGQAASPRLSQYYAAGRRGDFRSLVYELVLIGAILGAVGVLAALVAGRQLLTIFYGAQYARIDVFLWLSVAAGFAYIGSFLGYGMTAARRFRIQMPLFLAVVLMTALVCAVLVPKYKLLGAAYALVVAGIVQIVGSAFVLRYALRGHKLADSYWYRALFAEMP